MTALTKLALFGLALVTVFAASFAVGRAVEPTDSRPVPHNRHVEAQ